MNISINGCGRIPLASLHRLLMSHLTEGTTLTFSVRETAFWQEVRASGNTVGLSVTAYDGPVVYTSRLLLNNPDESFPDFIKRVAEQKVAGVWIYQDKAGLAQALIGSEVVGTCVGASNFEEVLCGIIDAHPKVGCVYAFENQPTLIADVANRYRDQVEVKHCVVDRVVVSREFDSEARVITVSLGMDESETVIINDPYGVWKKLLSIPEGKGPLIVTGDSGILNRMVKKKQYAKNTVHKLASHLAVRGKPLGEVKDRPLAELGELREIVELLELKESILLSAIAMSCSPQIGKDPDSAVFAYAEFSAYFDNSLRTVYADGKDTVGRLLHMRSEDEFRRDRLSLKMSVEELRSAVDNCRSFGMAEAALGGIITVSERKVKADLDKLIEFLSE